MPEKRSRQSLAQKDRFQLPKMGIRKRRPVHRRMALHWLFVYAPNSELVRLSRTSIADEMLVDGESAMLRLTFNAAKVLKNELETYLKMRGEQ
jgi:hypothetical protein